MAVAVIDTLPQNCRERRDPQEGWGVVLDATVDCWARAYLGLPAEPREHAVAELLNALPDRLLEETPQLLLELAAEHADQPVAA